MASNDCNGFKATLSSVKPLMRDLSGLVVKRGAGFVNRDDLDRKVGIGSQVLVIGGVGVDGLIALEVTLLARLGGDRLDGLLAGEIEGRGGEG